MQFITHRDPVNVGGWATALGATSDAVNNLLKIYTNYQQEKKSDAQRALENKFREDEMKLRQQNAERDAAHQKLIEQMQLRQAALQEAEKGIPGVRPKVKVGEQEVDAAPDFQVTEADARKPDAATPFGSTEIDTRLGKPLQRFTGAETDFGNIDLGQVGNLAQPRTTDQFKLDLRQPTKTEAVMGPAPLEQRTSPEIRDSQGNVLLPAITYDVPYEEEVRQAREEEARRARGDTKATPELIARAKAVSPTMGAYAEASGWVPASLMDEMIKAEQPKPVKAPTIQTIAGRDKQWDEQTGQWIDMGPHKAEKDPFEIPAGAALVVPGDISTVPPGLRAQVKAIAEGRQAPPALGNRPGSPGFQLMAYVNAYDPDASFEAATARWKAHQELNRGSATSRGGQLTNLNTFADHLDVLQKKSDELSKNLANSNWETINWLDQKMTRSGKKGPISAYEAAVNTFVTEYIKTLKGGSPTNQEQAEFDKLRNPALSPAERQAAINTLKEFVESRANEQETWYTQSFGRTSADDRDAGVKGRPFLGGRWVWDGSRWSIRTGGEHHAPSATRTNRTDKQGGGTADGEKKDPGGIRDF